MITIAFCSFLLTVYSGTKYLHLQPHNSEYLILLHLEIHMRVSMSMILYITRFKFSALTHVRPMFHLCRNQVAGFYKQNV